MAAKALRFAIDDDKLAHDMELALLGPAKWQRYVAKNAHKSDGIIVGDLCAVKFSTYANGGAVVLLRRALVEDPVEEPPDWHKGKTDLWSKEWSALKWPRRYLWYFSELEDVKAARKLYEGKAVDGVRIKPKMRPY